MTASLRSTIRAWGTRAVAAVLLGGAMLYAIVYDDPWLEIGAAIFAVLGAREWTRMVGQGRFLVETIATTAVVWLALLAFLVQPSLEVSAAVILAGTALLGLIGSLRRTKPLWQAAGVLYLGIPALSLIALRDFTGPGSHGQWVLIGLFLIIWAADTGAFVFGKFIGGPKMAPELSPNKTWSGAIGGVVAAAVIQAVYLKIGGGNWLAGAVYATGMAIVAHLGDLFESWAKRRFHVKDSGSMIPGHGGVLDRIDSTLATLVVSAVLVLLFKLDPLFGAYS